MRKPFLGVYHLTHKLCLLVADIVSLALAFSLASHFRLNEIPNFLSFEYVCLNLIVLFCIFLGNGYTSKSIGSAPRLPLNTLMVIILSSAPCTMFIYLLGPEKFTYLFGRGIFPVAIVLAGTLSLFSRLFLNRLFADKETKKHVLIVGDDVTSKTLNSAFKNVAIDTEFFLANQVNPGAVSADIDIIVISPDHSLSESEQKLLLDSRLSGIPIFSVSDFFESFLFLIPVNIVDNDWFIRSEGFTMLHSAVTIRLKRAMDILLSSLFLLLSVPVLALSAAGILLTSKGSVFFYQQRIGVGGKEFTIFKLRTMRANAESDGARWASSNDSRAFPFGRFLRKTRIDELPQCWNILKGDMSFVGPRPERPEFTSMLAKKIPYYELRHLVKPGLTGWAQVKYPYGASVEDSHRKLQYDLYYIKNYSLLLDLNILLRTTKVMVGLKGR